jgi:hypothetical protein
MLPLQVGGDLDPRHTDAVDEHIKQCLSCFREFRELAAMRGRLGVLSEEALPAGILDGFAEEVMARIAVGEPGPAADAPRPILRLRQVHRLAAAAAVLIVCFAGWRFMQDDGRLLGDGPVVGRPGTVVPGAEQPSTVGQAKLADPARPLVPLVGRRLVGPRAPNRARLQGLESATLESAGTGPEPVEPAPTEDDGLFPAAAVEGLQPLTGDEQRRLETDPGRLLMMQGCTAEALEPADASRVPRERKP